jgi:hypothetical protein
MTRQIQATVTGLGRQRVYVRDGLEKMQITVQRAHAAGLPFCNNERVAINLLVDGHRYQAGLRTRPYENVWISPDLIDCEGSRRTTLARVLTDHGFTPDEPVILEVTGRTVQLRKGAGAAE